MSNLVKSSINFDLLVPGVKISNYQKNIFTSVKETNNNLLISASAGSGKTFVLINSLKLIPKFRKSIFLSFNNSIVDSLKEKVPMNVKASTLHSLGMNFIGQYYPGIRVNPNKYLQLALDDYQAKNKEVFKKAYNIQDISNFVRMTLTKLEIDEISKMCDKYDVDYSEETIEKTIELIRNDTYPRHIDFADMVFLPAVKPDIVQEDFHNVFVDEAQDLSNAQIQFVKNIIKPEGRFIAVGDGFQSIYGFSGSDIESFNSLKTIENTVELPLSISYRCASRIVKEAQKFCPTIESHPKAEEGIVRWGGTDEIEDDDMVLCRNNAPLVDLYFELIESGKKAQIVGKEIEKGIIQLAEKCLAPIKDRFISNLMEQLDELINELIKKGVKNPAQHLRYQNLSDKIDLLEIICNKSNSVQEIIPNIKEIFVENEGEGVRLMTIHKAKGLESERVFFMKTYKGKQLIPSQYATQKWQIVQENNLEFVAITRAKSELVYFEM